MSLSTGWAITPQMVQHCPASTPEGQSKWGPSLPCHLWHCSLVLSSVSARGQTACQGTGHSTAKFNSRLVLQLLLIVMLDLQAAHVGFHLGRAYAVGLCQAAGQPQGAPAASQYCTCRHQNRPICRHLEAPGTFTVPNLMWCLLVGSRCLALLHNLMSDVAVSAGSACGALCR